MDLDQVDAAVLGVQVGRSSEPSTMTAAARTSARSQAIRQLRIPPFEWPPTTTRPGSIAVAAPISSMMAATNPTSSTPLLIAGAQHPPPFQVRMLTPVGRARSRPSG